MLIYIYKYTVVGNAPLKRTTCVVISLSDKVKANITLTLLKWKTIRLELGIKKIINKQ